ncbi:DUF4837 family protein [Rhodothermus profundi]|uniref:DUF4837 domain-containing protein n=1 Tax=Rhodothermus profundi TaxID=633813 RepID=A0A1M6QGZ5_9BACT|nr:DUF4837 family protein [Rhodothermus profundi]SHK19435.1 protein of unknown function [Rhodothermus profundi]
MPWRFATRLWMLGLPLVLGCGKVDYRPLAIGKNGEIQVVIDSTLWTGPVGEALRLALGYYVQTLPNPEPLFTLRPIEPRTQDDLDRIKKFKNVLFVAALRDSSRVSRLVQQAFSAEALQAVRAGSAAVVPRRDLWRRRQLVYFVVAETDSQLAAAIRQATPRLRAAFNEMAREWLAAEMFEKGRQFHLEDTLMAHHGFAVNVQHDYVIVLDTTRFVWLRRVLPDTWRSLFVYYEENADPARLTPAWIYATRDSLTRRYLQGNAGGFVQIDYRQPLETRAIDFLGRYGYETRGLWHMVTELADGRLFPAGMGGPFVNYTFYDQQSGRLYMIDGMVFAPGFRKREFLRQMEVIAYTFRTRLEAASTPATP